MSIIDLPTSWLDRRRATQKRSLALRLPLDRQGTDLVNSSITYSLALYANVENLTLTGANIINGTGSTGDDYLLGNIANNTLTGGAGN